MNMQWLPRLMQGVRFGIGLILMMGISCYPIYHSVRRRPARPLHEQLACKTTGGVLTRLVTAFANTSAI